MREYFKRLKEHPGIEYGIILPILGFLAGATNESFEWYVGGLFFGCFAVVITWSMILISNIKKK